MNVKYLIGKKECNDINNQRGITLIILVITIIIIIILSTIAINFTFGENGLITRAEQAKELAEVSTIQEQMEMIKAEELIEGQGTIDPDRYFDKLEDAGIILDKDTDVIDNGDGTYEVTADPDYVFDVTLVPDKENPTDLEIEYVGKGEVIGPRIRRINILEQTENSISVEVVTRDAEGATYTYSYRKEGESDWIDVVTNNSNTYVYERLEHSTTYEIKVKVETAEGVAEKETKVTLGAPEIAPEGTITFGEVTWSGYKASVTINTSAVGYSIEYQVNNQEEGQWQTVENNGIIPNLNHGDTIYARITSGNVTSGVQEKEIADTTNPTIVVDANGTTSSSVSVTVQAVDNESGMKDDSTYTYSIKESNQGDETYTTPENANGITNTSYTFTGLTQGTNYTVRVQVNGDKANNVGTGTLADQITGNIPSGGGDSGTEQGAITFGSVTWSAGKASIIISTEEEGYTIEYQINDTQEEQWEKVPENGQVTGLSHGDAVYARLTDGTNHGDYASTNIQDGVAPQKAKIELNKETLVAGEELTATITHIDNESGVDISQSKWILNTTEAELGTEDTSVYTETFESNGEKLTFNLNTIGTYYLHILTTDVVGNKTETISDVITITTITGRVTKSGETTWNNGKASIVLATAQSQYQIEYKINDGNWTKYNGTSVSGLNIGDIITARLTNDVTTSIESTFEIIDEAEPQVSVEGTGTTTNSVSVKVTASDEQSGMVASPKYTYSIKVTGAADSTYKTPTGANNITANTYTFTGLTQETNYTVRVTVNGDNAGNEGVGTVSNLTTRAVGGATSGLETGNIIASSPKWSDGKASITLTTTVGEMKIQYQIDSSSDDEWITIDSGESINGLSHGQTVYARLYDGINYGNYASIMVNDNVNPTLSKPITSDITMTKITTTVTASDGQSGLATSETYRYYLNNEIMPRATNTSGNYTFTGLNEGTTYTIKVVVTDMAGNETTKTTTATTVADVLPSVPELNDGMTPVKWNGSNWIKTDESEGDWYNYEEKEWANIVLGDAKFNSNGVLDENSAYSMLVWVPRYAYQITSQYHIGGDGAGNINVVFIDTDNKNKAGTKTYSTTYPSASTENGMSDYVVHPAFNYGGIALPGFWVGKYETSHTGCTTTASTGTTNTNVTTLTPMIKAGVTSWRNIQISNIFTVCANMNIGGNNYGLNSDDSVVDPHMMKNSEWGAVAYLSQNTSYGKGEEVWNNSNSSFLTGNAGSGVDAGGETSTDSYNEGNGPEASTTGNVTGIYDMSGGAWEYVAAYVNNGNSNLNTYGNTLANAATKYKDVYGTTTSTAHYGDAVYETDSWYNDDDIYPSSNNVFFHRGGNCNNTSIAGVFYFNDHTGVAHTHYGFRVTLPVLSGKEISIKDETKPNLTVRLSKKTLNSITISVQAEDYETGIAEYEFYRDGNLIETQQTSGTSISYTYDELSEETTYRLKVIVKDGAGNSTEKEITATTESAVASIGDDKYYSLSEAIATVPNDGTQTTIELLKSTDEIIEISSGKNIILNMNENTLNQSISAIKNYGTLQVKNGIINAPNSNAVIGFENSNTIIEKITANSGLSTIVAYEKADMTITGGSIIKCDFNTACIGNIGGIINITGATITENMTAIDNQSGEVNISGDTEISSQSTGRLITNMGTLTISEGTITNMQGMPIYNEGMLNVSGSAKISSGADYTAIFNTNELNVQGGNINSTQHYGIYNDETGTANIGGTTQISGKIAFGNLGTANVTGGTLTTDTGDAIVNEESGTITISGNTQLTGIYDYTTFENRGISYINGADLSPNISGTIGNSGSMTITAGKFECEASTFAAITNKSNGTLKIQGENIEIISEGAGVGNVETAEIIGMPTIIGNRNAVQNGKIGDIENNLATLKINGGNISTDDSNAITNEANMEIDGNANISNSSSSYPTLHNKSTLIVKGGTITNKAKGYSVYNDGGTVEHIGGTLSTPYRIN